MCTGVRAFFEDDELDELELELELELGLESRRHSFIRLGFGGEATERTNRRRGREERR